MSFSDQIANYSAADIMTALHCPRGTAYDWKDGRREPPAWQQPHWLDILRQAGERDADAKRRKRAGKKRSQ